MSHADAVYSVSILVLQGNVSLLNAAIEIDSNKHIMLIYIYLLINLLTYLLGIYMYMIYNDSECSARPHGGMADLGGSLLEPRAGLSITTGSRPRAHLPMQ